MPLHWADRVFATTRIKWAGYPYHVAALYAAQLWLNQTQGQIGVVLTIVTPEVEDQPKDLQQYVR